MARKKIELEPVPFQHLELKADMTLEMDLLVTTKKVYFDSMLNELLWFIKGATNINDNLNTKIWDAWADSDGNLGQWVSVAVLGKI